MKITKRNFLRSILAIAMITALSGSASASGTAFPLAPMAARGNISPPGNEGIDRGVGSARELGFDFKSSLLEPGEADGAGIPGISNQKAENAPVAGPSLMVFIGLGLIAVALWGKKRFQKDAQRTAWSAARSAERNRSGHHDV